MTIKSFDTNVTFTDVITLNGVIFDLTGATVLFLMRSNIGGKVFSDTASITANQTSGTLIKGASYKIITYVSGDDFTNIGGTNVSGTIFTATGTTPTTWSHGSALTGSNVTYQPGAGFPTAVGGYNQEWEITSGGKVFTFPSDSYQPVRIMENLEDS